MDRTVEVVNNGVATTVQVPWWIITPEQEEKKQVVLKSQFFLLRQGEMGEIFRCNRCNGKHKFFTLMCIDRPFDGLREGLAAYFTHAGKYGAEKYLSTVEYKRYETIRQVLSRPDLASAHPSLAKGLGTGDADFDVGAVSLGLLEPITKAKAIALAWNINLRGLKPPFRLEGLENASV